MYYMKKKNMLGLFSECKRGLVGLYLFLFNLPTSPETECLNLSAVSKNRLTVTRSPEEWF